MTTDTTSQSTNTKWRTDWLATKPVFYNTKTKAISHHVNDVIDFQEIEFHPEGFNNFIEWGYSILEQTPIKNVKFLPPNAELRLTDAGELEMTRLPDPVDELLDYRLSETDIIDLLEEKIIAWEKTTQGNIILPLSGGCDSRLLAYLLPDKSKLRAFSYGISPWQEDSFEVVYARDLCKNLGIQWKQIPLGGYHQYFDEWNRIFGVSMHAHGMYHIEFYKKIMQIEDLQGLSLLSGITGVWTGGAGQNIPPGGPSSDIRYLRQENAMHGDQCFSRIPAHNTLQERYFEHNKHRLQDPRLRNIEAKRWKMMFLSYLLRLPDALGMRAWSPLPDPQVALAVLNLPEKRRENKTWVKEYFEKNGIGFSQLSPPIQHHNTLNHQAMRILKPAPLDAAQLEPFISPDYIQWINASLAHHEGVMNTVWNMIKLPKINRIFKLVNIRDERKAAYAAYLTLKPIEYLLNNQK